MSLKNVKTKNYYKVLKKKQQKINRLHLNILNLIYINNMYVYIPNSNLNVAQ